ncbi:MAG: hypothetical protein SGILL_009549, partial [Bacillariaceae sp.]
MRTQLGSLTNYDLHCFTYPSPTKNRLFSSPSSSSTESSNANGDGDGDNEQHRKRILDATSPDDYPIVKDTLDWLNHVVMGLNLCPFAKPSFIKDQIHIQVVHGGNPTDVLAQVVEECWKLKQIDNSDDAGGTTL